MKFVVDEQLPPLLVQWLRDFGHDAHHVVELGLGGSPDRAIRDGSADAVIITKDEDFARIRRRSDGPILWVRCGNLRRALFMQRLVAAWPEAYQRLSQGEQLVETTLAP